MAELVPGDRVLGVLSRPGSYNEERAPVLARCEVSLPDDRDVELPVGGISDATATGGKS